MIDCEGALETVVLQVGIEHGDLLGQHHALVDDRAAGQRTDIEFLDLRLCHGLFDPAADDVKLALERILVDVLEVRDQNLLDLWPGSVCLGAQTGHIDRHMAPAIDVVPHAQHFALDDGPAFFLRAEIGARQKYLANGDHLVGIGLVAGPADLVIEELDGDLDVNACAVAGLAVRVDRAAVPDRLQRLDAVLDHLAGPLAVDADHQADTAGRMLFGLGVHAMLRHVGALGFLFGFPVRADLGVEFRHRFSFLRGQPARPSHHLFRSAPVRLDTGQRPCRI